MKHEWRKQEKNFYIPKTKPELINIPKLNFISIQGQGHPNKEPFSQCVEALYAFSYAVRMCYKGKDPLKNYFEYTVYPLEGIWDLIDPAKGPSDKNNFKYTLMIRQPSFLKKLQVQRFIDQAYQKTSNDKVLQLRFETIEEGPCIQILHLGPYDNEPESFTKMEAYCQEQGLQRKSMVHREIYLTDARKVAPEKLKTTLRFQTNG